MGNQHKKGASYAHEIMNAMHMPTLGGVARTNVARHNVRGRGGRESGRGGRSHGHSGSYGGRGDRSESFQGRGRDNIRRSCRGKQSPDPRGIIQVTNNKVNGQFPGVVMLCFSRSLGDSPVPYEALDEMRPVFDV